MKCGFCSQDHVPRVSDVPGSLLFGVPLNVCPNMPSDWMMVDGGQGAVIVDLNEVQS